MAASISSLPYVAPVRVVIEGEPRSKARHRFTKNGQTYADPRGKSHEQLLARHFELVIKEPFPANVSVTASFYRSNKQRIDVDNLMKAVLDAATGIVWVDDVQVTFLSARIELDPDHPRTEVVFVDDPHSSMPRGTAVDVKANCERCGQAFTYREYASRGPVRFCSTECVRAGRGSGECAQCGATFRRRSPSQRYCTAECGYKARHERSQTALPDCRQCGKKLHRRGAVLCRECWLKRGNKKKRKSDYLGEAA